MNKSTDTQVIIERNFARLPTDNTIFGDAVAHPNISFMRKYMCGNTHLLIVTPREAMPYKKCAGRKINMEKIVRTHIVRLNRSVSGIFQLRDRRSFVVSFALLFVN